MKGSFVAKINYLLAEKQISRRQFTEDLGINKNQFHRWETGRNAPMRKSVQTIADYFMVVPQSLVDPERDIEYTYTATPIDSNMSFLPLSDQERMILMTFRDSSAATQMRMIQAILNLADKEQDQ